MDNYPIWDAVSFAWTEIGLEDREYPEYAKKIREYSDDWNQVNRIIILDVCGSFAFDTFLIFPCMLWMIMADWGYNEDYLRERMKKWYSKPYWKHFLNPLRLLGYPLAIVMSYSVRRKIKKAFIELIKNT